MGRQLRTRTTMRPTLAIIGLTLLTACGGSLLGVDGSCVAVVNVGGTLFTPLDSALVQAGDIEEVVVVVSLDTGCLDQGEPSSPLGHGESNFLEVGTEIRRVTGYAAEERLTYWAPVVAEWLALAPVS
jgi:hypothetical protein